ncbi:MAG: class I SAM-dependent methyltransferase [Cyclobacteriaceae bacterium]|nr:class I SAM-dependent methyltransferase [Cyclobacteriaceae bacterium]MCH8515231.1 class I SAM-dependent methyltransferase [Cyclobacteriaceae bacterium]
MSTYTTEITSDKIPSDNPIHQRLLQAYYLAIPYIKGDLLELGCGEGRGLELLKSEADTYTAVDKIEEVIDRLSAANPEVKFIHDFFPPLNKIADESADVVVSFQVIEHIEDDLGFLKEIYRVLRPGGTALLTTPNQSMSLTRNPWHIREYLADEFATLLNAVFDKVTVKGITGNQKVMKYYQENKKSVEKITRFDIFDLQNRLPASLLKMPYDILNRLNRNKLSQKDQSLVQAIKHTDYILSDEPHLSLDLFGIVEK